jgi:hypothetical protein
MRWRALDLEREREGGSGAGREKGDEEWSTTGKEDAGWRVSAVEERETVVTEVESEGNARGGGSAGCEGEEREDLFRGHPGPSALRRGEEEEGLTSNRWRVQRCSCLLFLLHRPLILLLQLPNLHSQGQVIRSELQLRPPQPQLACELLPVRLGALHGRRSSLSFQRKLLRRVDEREILPGEGVGGTKRSGREGGGGERALTFRLRTEGRWNHGWS